MGNVNFEKIDNMNQNGYNTIQRLYFDKNYNKENSNRNFIVWIYYYRIFGSFNAG